MIESDTSKITIYDYETDTVLLSDENSTESIENSDPEEILKIEDELISEEPQKKTPIEKKSSKMQLDSDGLFSLMKKANTITRELVGGVKQPVIYSSPVEQGEDSGSEETKSGTVILDSPDMGTVVTNTTNTEKKGTEVNLPKEREIGENDTTNEAKPENEDTTQIVFSDDENFLDTKNNSTLELQQEPLKNIKYDYEANYEESSAEIYDEISADLSSNELELIVPDALHDEISRKLDELEERETEELDLSLLDELESEFEGLNSEKKQEQKIQTHKKEDKLHLKKFTEKLDKQEDLLSEQEKKSIEQDIKKEHSIVIEEKYEDIRNKLIKIWKYKHISKSTSTQKKNGIKTPPKYYATQPVSSVRRPPSFASIPSPGFSKDEKKSIEKDIEAEHSIVIEENIHDIHDQLMKMWEDYSNQFTDISDQVIVFNDEVEVRRFINQFDTKQQREDMQRLLNYFEKMFQEMPEELLTKFITSEYYDLYRKLLTQMDT